MNTVDSLKGKFGGGSIAVLGSGPSLSNFLSDSTRFDYVIACNGSVLALGDQVERVDCFMYADEFSPTRDWFELMGQRALQGRGKVLRIMPHFLVPFDSTLFPEGSADEVKVLKEDLERKIKANFNGVSAKQTAFDQYMGLLERGVQYDDVGDRRTENRLRIEFNRDGAEMKKQFYKYEVPSEVNINGIPITLKGFYEDFERDVPIPEIIASHGSSQETQAFFMNGTISCTATQIARLMGAGSIHLFGCDFNNGSGENYSYDKGKNYPGNTSDRCREVFDAYLQSLLGQGIEVSHHGKTTLSAPLRVK